MTNPYRCKICGRYMSKLDASDLWPQTCLACEDKLRAKWTRRACVAVLVIWILAVVAFVLAWPKITSASPFVSEYFVSGANIDTGERVVGYLTGQLGEPNVGGVVYDRGDRWTVVGVYQDGVFTLRSLCCRYQCMNVPEVSANKLRNKFEWEE